MDWATARTTALHELALSTAASVTIGAMGGATAWRLPEMRQNCTQTHSVEEK